MGRLGLPAHTARARFGKPSRNSQFGPSEANTSINLYNSLSASSKQDVLNFLRSL
jgi:hypothetical protein